MSGDDAELSRELTRIVRSPYPASLVKLADILTRSNALLIRACIRHRSPCAIVKLANIVYAALPQWPYTIGILQALSHSPEFREQLLLQNQGLLDALLIRTNSSQHAFEEYAELCVTLLSSPLPECVSLPASVQSFFSRLFEEATRCPDVGSLRPIYRLLNGACKGFLSLIPAGDRDRFDDSLCKILKDPGQNVMTTIWCFGIAVLMEHSEVVGNIRLADASPAPQAPPPQTLKWKTMSGRKVFGVGNGCAKTIRLGYLSVVLAANGNAGISDFEAMEAIRIAARTLHFIDPKEREAWSKSNDRSIFEKLPFKLQRTAIDPDVQLEALGVYAMVAGPSNIAPELVTLYGTILIDIGSLRGSDSLKENLSMSLPLFALHMEEPSVHALLAKILRSCISPASTLEMSHSRILVDELATIIPDCPQFRTRMLQALCTNELKDGIQKIIQVKVQHEDNHSDQHCRPYSVALHRALLSGIVSLLLIAVVTSKPEEPSLPHPIGIALIKKQQGLSSIDTQCLHANSTPRLPPVSLFQQECTPLSAAPLQNWREHLRTELDNQGTYQRESVIRSVAQICHDLENRCENVEEPLRRERKKSKTLEAELSAVRKRLESIEQRRTDDELCIEGLEADIVRLDEDKSRDLSKIKRLKLDLDDANTRAEKALRAAEESYRTVEAQLRSNALQLEEALRSREETIEGLRDTSATLNEKVKQQEEERAALEDSHNSFRARLDDAQNELESHRSAVTRQADEITGINCERNDLEKRLQDRELALSTITEQLGGLQVQLHETIQSSSETLRKMEVQHKNDMDTAASNAAEEIALLNTTLEKANHRFGELTNAYEDCHRECQQLRATVPSLKADIRELTDNLEEKDCELGALRSRQNKVLALMGDQPIPPLVRSTSRPDRDSHNFKHASQHRRRKSAMHGQDSVPVAAQTITDTAVEDVANASFTSTDSQFSQNGSTPKRSKRGTSFKVPALHTPYSNKPVLASKVQFRKASPSKRPALAESSPNRRHTTVGFRLLENQSELDLKSSLPLRRRRPSLQENEQADFDVDEFLACTPFTPGAPFISGTGKIPEDDASATEL